MEGQISLNSPSGLSRFHHESMNIATPHPSNSIFFLFLKEGESGVHLERSTALRCIVCVFICFRNSLCHRAVDTNISILWLLQNERLHLAT